MAPLAGYSQTFYFHVREQKAKRRLGKSSSGHLPVIGDFLRVSSATHGCGQGRLALPGSRPE